MYMAQPIIVSLSTRVGDDSFHSFVILNTNCNVDLCLNPVLSCLYVLFDTGHTDDVVVAGIVDVDSVPLVVVAPVAGCDGTAADVGGGDGVGVIVVVVVGGGEVVDVVAAQYDSYIDSTGWSCCCYCCCCCWS